jgi:2,3-bisphosphoglycerate-dependent phosphoglycerate mutase
MTIVLISATAITLCNYLELATVMSSALYMFGVSYPSILIRLLSHPQFIPSVSISLSLHLSLSVSVDGALTGMSKQMIGQRHGDHQLRLWRRSYATQPPKVSSFSAFYPGNDQR